ncbi:hypothetical protein PIIN_10341 [Serendipita indica DSM 11827]|uniref:Uncharacterized protein n=1 Tax=Serendipita indica (strain DSM 11827) TaxID=1109443 RepID=G4TYF3_SERID|nr:hypothetical protein PIIN_10341 [Serendipita indica DSM 11827]
MKSLWEPVHGPESSRRLCIRLTATLEHAPVEELITKAIAYKDILKKLDLVFMCSWSWVMADMKDESKKRKVADFFSVAETMGFGVFDWDERSILTPEAQRLRELVVTI